MLQTMLNVFKIKELRQKILFTLAMLAVYRIGHWIPLPGANHERLSEIMNTQTDSSNALSKAANFVTMFSGGDLAKATIFGLGIMPYITAGIIFQLLATALPALKRLQEEGPTGRQKIQEWTRYATVALSIVQGFVWITIIRGQGLLYPSVLASPLWWVTAVAALVAGTVFLMWIGEQID